LYGAEPNHFLGAVHPEKDAVDLLVLEEVERRKLPLLAICFGLQALNVSRRGTLIQDIRSQCRDSVKHQQGAPRDRTSHGVSFADGSQLAAWAKDVPRRINSHHHQAIDKVGENLVPTALAPDGLIEAVEDPRTDRWVIGVQWHPELGWSNDHLSKRMFNAFVSAAHNRQSPAFDAGQEAGPGFDDHLNLT
jgi:putative glutamine amidotransferase